MKLVFTLLALLFVNSQQQRYTYHPSLLNLFRYNPMRAFQDAYYPWSRFADEPQNRLWGNQREELVDFSDETEEDSNSAEKSDYFLEARTKANKFKQEQINEDQQLNRLLYNQGANGVLGQQIGFPFKTYVYTTVRTKTITTFTNCIPASLIGRGVTNCVRRRRDISAYLDFLASNDSNIDFDPVQPSPTQKVETTALASKISSSEESSQSELKETPLVLSSKVEGDAELQESDSGVVRAKRLLFAAKTTLTSYRFTTTTLPRRVSIGLLLGGNPCAPGIVDLQCALACIPPDYSIC